jgi:haloalkane dehalogenase
LRRGCQFSDPFLGPIRNTQFVATGNGDINKGDHSVPTVNVLDSTMAYEESGVGTPIVFLHGNATTSRLWRNVLPAVGKPGRLISPDLIGMGASGKPDISYRFDDQARYVAAFMDTLGLGQVVLVGHDWGGPLAFDWAARNPERVVGVAFLEAIMRPLKWEEFAPSARPMFESVRTPGMGEKLVLETNAFVEQSLSRGVITGLSDADLSAYLEPYPTSESRRPLLAWPRELPLGGEPADVVARFESFDRWLATSTDVPKLLMTFDPAPGLLIGPEMAHWCNDNIAVLEIVACGPAGHHAPEDQPDAIAAAIAGWVDRHRLR